MLLNTVFSSCYMQYHWNISLKKWSQMAWTTFFEITFYLFFINKCSMHLFMIILVLIGYSLWPSHCFFLSVFDAWKQSMAYNICINNVSRCWLWCRDSHHMTYCTFLCHNVLISFLFYRMKASQYMILNTKNKIGKEIRKNLSILQYSSANCWTETALTALSCTSYLKLSLHTILMFILCWPDTYRCFLNNIAAYLKFKKYLKIDTIYPFGGRSIQHDTNVACVMVFYIES